MEKVELFQEIDTHLLQDYKPSDYFKELIEESFFKDTEPFTMLSCLIDVQQNLKFHPEGSVWNHTLMVVDEAARRRNESSEKRIFMWSALLHDIGKAPTTRIRKGKITSYNHEKWGRNMSRKFLKEFNEDDIFIKKVSSMVRWHMEALFVVKELPFADIGTMLKEVSLSEIALLNLCDRLGRGGMTDKKAEDEEKGIKLFVERCRGYMDGKEYKY